MGKRWEGKDGDGEVEESVLFSRVLKEGEKTAIGYNVRSPFGCVHSLLERVHSRSPLRWQPRPSLPCVSADEVDPPSPRWAIERGYVRTKMVGFHFHSHCRSRSRISPLAKQQPPSSPVFSSCSSPPTQSSASAAHGSTDSRLLPSLEFATKTKSKVNK